MATPTIEVQVDLGIPQDDDFLIGDATRGVIGSSFLISSGFTSVAADAYRISISRGRFTRLWDSVEAGTCNISLWNHDRDFDPAFLDGPYAGSIVPGRGVQITANQNIIWTGFVDDWELSYDVSGQSVATMKTTDALGVLGQMQFDEWVSSGDTAELKFTQALGRPEVAWPAGQFGSDAGLETLQSETVTWGSNVLNYLQLISRSVLGYFFANREGVLVFRNRNFPLGGTPSVSFSDDNEIGTIPYHGIQASSGAELLFARVGVDREGGVAQSATVPDLAEWRENYGPARSLSIPGTLLASDAQSLAMAQYLLDLYDTPRYRVSEIEVDVTGLTYEQQTSVVFLDVADTVEVKFTPNGVGDPITQPLVVQGIRHDISVDRHIVTLSVIDIPLPFFRIGSATFGVIDGSSVLGF